MSMARPKKSAALNAFATLGLRISKALRGDLEALAKATGRSLTDEARTGLERHVATSNIRKSRKART